MSGWRKLA